MKYLLLLLVSGSVHASENWFCSTDSQAFSDDSMSICGVGEASQEGKARQVALDDATISFHKLCNEDDNCKEMRNTVEPMRTTCSETNGIWKCFRMVTFRFGGLRAASRTPAISTINDGQLKKGMTRSEVYNLFGPPQATSGDDWTGADIRHYWWSYQGAICASSSCTIQFEEGRVSNWQGVKPQLQNLEAADL